MKQKYAVRYWKIISYAFYAVFVAVLSAPSIHAQERALSQQVAAKLDIGLKERIAEYVQRGASSKLGDEQQRVPVIFKSNASNVAAIIAAHKGRLDATLGTIYTAVMPLSELAAFAGEGAIERIESPGKVSCTNDKARQLVGADKVLAGDVAGGVPFTGKGVVVGVFDSGIDFAHPDFRQKNDKSKTRILSIWDQTLTTDSTPKNFQYGTEFLPEAINGALDYPESFLSRDDDGHGTHVAGTAAGLRGMAPDADIVFVKAKIDWKSDSTVYTDTKALLDGAAYCIAKAQQAGKPCVLNFSIGYYIGAAHDGSSLVEQGFDNAVSSRPGTMICIAAGNETGKSTHFGGVELTGDSLWTYANLMNESMLYATFDTKNEAGTFISVLTDSAAALGEYQDSIVDQKTKFQSPWISLKELLEAPNGMTFKTVYDVSDSIATTKLLAARTASNKVEVRITMTRRGKTAFKPEKLTLFRLAFKGSGMIHGWWENYQVATVGGNPIYYQNIARNDRFREHDDMYNMNILAGGRKTFAIGAYVNKEYYTDSKGAIRYGLNFMQNLTGSIAMFSNLGPTTDGRIKPDFCAPGVNIASSKSRSVIVPESMLLDSNTVVFSGTSMASPVAAGAIALYLEKYPTASYEQLYAALLAGAESDSLTLSDGALPNKTWGHGRLTIFKAMNAVSAVEESKTAGTACDVIIYPNPSAHTITFGKPMTASRKQELIIFDAVGNRMRTLDLSDNRPLDVSDMAKGVYLYRLCHGNDCCSGSFIVE